MWKYVTRRIKDTVERSYNVLDVCRPWACAPDKVCENGPIQPNGCDSVAIISNPADTKTIDVWKEPKSEEKFQSNYSRCQFSSDVFGALSWVSSIYVVIY